MNVSFADFFRSILETAKFWYMVNPWERAVRVRAGRYSRQMEPGTYLRIPFVDTVVTVNTRLRITSTPSVTVTTTDGKTVTLSVMVGFRISEPLVAMKALKDPEYTCAALVQAAAATSAAQMRAEVLGSERFVESIRAQLNEDSLPGITIEQIKVTEMAIVRTFRLLQDQWKPMTSIEKGANNF